MSQAPVNLDAIDRKLLDLLQSNGRVTQSELAAGVGLSQPSVAERVRKLEERGVIQGYTAVVDARSLGRSITAFIGVTVGHPRHNKGFVRTLAELADVLECHHVTGAESYLLKVKTESTESLDRLISEQIRTIPGVSSTHTMISLSCVKEGLRVDPWSNSDNG